MDRGMIVKWFEFCQVEDKCSADCPYWDNVGSIECTKELGKDVLTLLNEHEAVEPFMDYDGEDVWRCGKCGNSLMHPSYYESDEDVKDEKSYIRYCSHCGQAVKWK